MGTRYWLKYPGGIRITGSPAPFRGPAPYLSKIVQYIQIVLFHESRRRRQMRKRTAPCSRVVPGCQAPVPPNRRRHDGFFTTGLLSGVVLRWLAPRLPPERPGERLLLLKLKVWRQEHHVPHDVAAAAQRGAVADYVGASCVFAWTDVFGLCEVVGPQVPLDICSLHICNFVSQLWHDVRARQPQPVAPRYSRCCLWV